MARPTGRYFASVIAKIRDARKKEQIVVDEGFKMQLRQQLMTKIAANMTPDRVSWMERLAPFKSYLGVVSALALVIVAVVGISKLPIQFQSGVVVPTSDSQQDVSLQTVPTEQTSQTPNLSAETGSSGLKTFPGRLVMPSNRSGTEGSANVLQYAQPLAESAAGQQDPVVPQSVYADPETGAASQTSPAQDAPQQKVPEQQPVSGQSAATVPAQILQYFAFNPEQKTASVGEGNVLPATAPGTETSTRQPLPSVSGSVPLTSQDVSAASGDASVSGSVPSVAYGEEDAPVVESEKQEVSAAMKTTTTTAITEPAVSYSTTAAKIYKPEPEEVTLQVNEIAALPAKQMDLNVFYNGNFSSDEQTVLEQNLLPHLIDGREADFDYAYVYQKDPATIVIQLIYFDHNNKFYEYKVDAAGNWNLVQG